MREIVWNFIHTTVKWLYLFCLMRIMGSVFRIHQIEVQFEWCNPKIYLQSLSALLFNTLASGRKRGFSKKHRNACGFAWELLRSCSGYGPGRRVKRRSKSSSLHSKKNFLVGGCEFFCEWRHKWRAFRPPWPTLPGPGRQLLDGSISLKFLLDSRLQSWVFWYFGWLAGVSGSKVMI